MSDTPHSENPEASAHNQTSTPTEDQSFPRRVLSRVTRLDPRVALVNREFSSLMNEKTLVLALLIQIFIATFSSFLVVGLVSMYSPGEVGNEKTAGVVGNATGDFFMASEETQLNSRPFESRSAAVEALKSGEIDAIVYANDRPGGGIHIEAIVPQQNLQMTLTVSQIQRTLETLEQQQRQFVEDQLTYKPLVPPDAAGTTPYFTFTYTVLLPMLVFLPVFISGSIVVDTITEEQSRGTLEVLRTAPISVTDILDAKLLVATVLAPLQVTLWICLLKLNNIAVTHIPEIVGFTAALTLLVVILGVGIALRFETREKAQLVYSGALFGVFAIMSFFPQHPANVVARFAVGTPTTTTYAILALCFTAGVVSYVLLRATVSDAHGTVALRSDNTQTTLTED